MFSLLLLLYLLPMMQYSATPASPLPDARFVRDLHDKKVDDVLELYTADAVFVQPDGTEVSGPGLRKLYEQVTTSLDSDLHLHATVLGYAGGKVEESGEYTETLRHRDTGKVDEIKGTYKFAGRMEADGSWRFTRMEWH